MYIETKKLIAKFSFINTVITCGIIFLCGTLTASQKTAYNIYLREYSVMTMSNTSDSIDVNLDGKSYCLALPEKSDVDRALRYLKLTPLATGVYFAQNLYNSQFTIAGYSSIADKSHPSGSVVTEAERKIFTVRGM